MNRFLLLRHVIVPVLAQLALCPIVLINVSASQALDRRTDSGGGSSRVHLIVPIDLQFDGLVRAHFPSVANSAEYAPIKLTSVIVANDTPFEISAITVVWNIVNSDGTQNTLYTVVSPPAIGSKLLPSRKAVLEPNEFSLVSPIAHEEENSVGGQAISSAHVIDAYVHADSKYSNSPLLSSLLAAKTINARIDGIVFSSGAVAGRDNYGLFQKFTCERNGVIGEASRIKDALEQGEPVERILETDVAAGLAAGPHDTTCQDSMGRTASHLLTLLRTQGTDVLRQDVVGISQAQPRILHRVAPDD